MQRLKIKRTITRAAMLLIMMLTTASAWADVQTVTYTIGYKSGSGYYLTGDDGTQSAYFSLLNGIKEVTLSLGSDVTFHIANPHNQRLRIGGLQESDAAAYGFPREFDTDIDVTVTSASRYVAYMKLIGSGHINYKQVQIPQEVHNDQQSCTMEWRTVYGVDNVGGVGKFVITYSTTQYAYKLHYMVAGSEVSGHGNPAYYESAVGATLTNLTKTGYDFDGWHDNDAYTGSTISSISAGTTGEKTLYAKWALITYSIAYEKNEGHFNGTYRTSYNVTTNTFTLSTPSRNGYYFRGWFEDEDFAGRAVTQIKQGSTGDRTFYAKWEEWEAAGNGQIWNPYKISSEADLRALATKVNGGDRCKGVYYQQTCDITITGGDWTPIGNRDNYFVGNYDGGNYTISGININSTSDYQGLFGKVIGTPDQKWGFIQNIILENSTIAGGSCTGGIVGWVGNAHVHNCHVRSSVTIQAGADGSASYNKEYGFGGVVGYFHNGTVKGCTSMATVNNGGHTNVRYFGGVIGEMKEMDFTATATNCYSYGKNPIGYKDSGTATNVERVYQMSCTDGSVSLPDEVSATDGFYYNGRGYNKAGVAIPLTVTIGEAPAGYDLVVTHTGNNVITPNEDGDYFYTVATANKAFTATFTPSTTLALAANGVEDGGVTNYWTTFYCGDAGYKIDDEENACAYTATYASNTLTLHKLGKVIPQGTAVIIVGAFDCVGMTKSTAAAENTVSNDLHGVDVRTLKSSLDDTGAGTFYVLSKKGDDFGFFEYTGAYMPARKAYLLINGGAALAKGLTMVFDNDDVTGVNEVIEVNEVDDDSWYTLDGRKLSGKPTKKGMYIVNGKKIVIK